MSEIKHTPGPWEAGDIVRNGLPFTPVQANTLIAKVYSTAYGDEAQSIANAHLMAASPDMLVALKRALWVVASLEGASAEIGSIVKDVRAAIAKAEGRT